MKSSIKGLLATTSLITMAAMPATAQTVASGVSALPVQDQLTDTDEAAKKDDIVVTGTRIVNPNIKSAAPIQTLSAQEIKLSGAVNIEEALNRLPQVYSFNPAADQESAGQAQIQLRQFGSGHQSAQNTLPLIDGQRIAGPLAIDVNAIPTSLVERVDVLTGGAAAVYGPDALAGVVNFILKKDFEGVQIDANYGFFNHQNRRNVVTDTADKFLLPYPLGTANDGGRANLNIAAGHRFFDDRLSISGYFSYRQTDPIYFPDRSLAACQLLQSTFDQPTTCGVTATSPYGRIVPLSGPNAGTSFINASDGSSRVFHVLTLGDRVSRYGPSYQLLRGNERYNAGGFLKLTVTDWAELYGSVMYTNNKSTASYDPSSLYAGQTANGYQLNCNNPLMSAQQAQLICGAAAGTSTLVPIDFAYRYLNYDPQTISYRQRILRGTLGMRGDFAEAWHYDIGGVVVKSTNQGVISANQLPNLDNVNKALNVVTVNGTPTCVAKVNGTDANCVPLDIFRGLAGSPAEYNYIFNAITPGVTRTDNYFVDGVASVSGDLGHYGIRSPLAANGVQIALTGEIRREVVHSFADANYNTILSGAPNPTSSSRAGQTIKEGAVELQLPLVQNKWWTKELTLGGGYRLSKYGSVKKLFETWKVEGSWSPVEDITFRASKNKASRSPNVYEASPVVSYRQITGFVDPCGPTPVVDVNGRVTGYNAPTMSLKSCQKQRNWQDSFYNNPALLCPQTGCVFRDGIANNLGPQEADTFTYGVVLKPRFLPRFTFSIDHYKIQFTNQISSFGQGDFVSLCAEYAVNPTALNQLACGEFYRNANGTLYGSTSAPQTGFISSETVNIPGKSSMAEGIDLQGHYDVPLWSLGRLNLDFNGSITERAGVGNGKAGYFSTFVGDPIPKWRHNARLTYETNDQVFSASFNWRYIGGTVTGLNHAQEIIGRPLDPSDIPGVTLPQKTFAKINPYSYFDLGFTARVAKRLTLTLVVNNLLDKDPPIVPAYGGLGSPSISGGYQNAVTNFYDLYGRYIQFGVSTRF